MKTISFLVSQMAQHNAATPTKNCFLSFKEKPLSQEPNMSTTLVGAFTPKAKKIAFHTNFAT